jgi:UDP-MurNAc hydroxylase
MEVEFLGHAGFVVECGGVSILIDPWFFPAFLRSWFPYPDNRFLLDEVAGRSFDAVYVSHVHEDHFDRRFLERLDRSTPVLCADYRSRSLLRAWKSLGFRDVTVLGHGDSLQLADGFEATLVLDSSHREDSGLLLEGDGVRFLDLNDCLVKLGELPTGIDVLTRQFSGASWYPNCYRHPPDDMAAKVAKVRRNLLDTLTTVCDVTGARWYVPTAGPPCFLDPALADLGPRDATIFPVWPDVADDFAAASAEVGVVPILPGDRLRFRGADPVLVEGPLHTTPETPMAEYARVRTAEWSAPAADVAPVSGDELRTHLARRIRKNPGLVDDCRRTLRIVADDRAWTVVIDAGVLEVEPSAPEDPYDCSFEMPAWVLREAVDRDDWEDVFLSMRVRLHREPDLYDVRLMGFLRYGGQPVIAKQLLADMAPSDESVEVCDLRVQRYCPHSGEDLSHAIVHGSVIECPRHHWKWNIDTGECIEGGTLPLRVERLAPALAGTEGPAS